MAGGSGTTPPLLGNANIVNTISILITLFLIAKISVITIIAIVIVNIVLSIVITRILILKSILTISIIINMPITSIELLCGVSLHFASHAFCLTIMLFTPGEGHFVVFWARKGGGFLAV